MCAGGGTEIAVAEDSESRRHQDVRHSDRSLLEILFKSLFLNQDHNGLQKNNFGVQEMRAGDQFSVKYD
jgi:hypothetical protein